MDHNNEANDSEMWDWQCTESFLEDNLDMSNCIWDNLNQNEDISFPFQNEFTPVKGCGDFADYLNICDTSKELEKCGEHSSQVKRRRLHFPPETLDTPPQNGEIASGHPILKEREESAVEGFSKMSLKVSGYSECTSSSSSETFDQPPDAWLASCLNDSEMHYSPSNMASDAEIDVIEIPKSQIPPRYASMNQGRPVHPRGNVFKGRKSFIQTPTKLASSIVYPFAFIKPCGILGDTTLKDINQRIRTPPPKLKQNNEDPSSYPTSAFSGKPVVGRTTLSTDGGRGSITIMRTKG